MGKAPGERFQLGGPPLRGLKREERKKSFRCLYNLKEASERIGKTGIISKNRTNNSEKLRLLQNITAEKTRKEKKKGQRPSKFRNQGKS